MQLIASRGHCNGHSWLASSNPHPSEVVDLQLSKVHCKMRKQWWSDTEMRRRIWYCPKRYLKTCNEIGCWPTWWVGLHAHGRLSNKLHGSRLISARQYYRLSFSIDHTYNAVEDYNMTLSSRRYRPVGEPCSVTQRSRWCSSRASDIRVVAAENPPLPR